MNKFSKGDIVHEKGIRPGIPFSMYVVDGCKGTKVVCKDWDGECTKEFDEDKIVLDDSFYL